jgi:hypothetical protein
MTHDDATRIAHILIAILCQLVLMLLFMAFWAKEIRDRLPPR